MVAESNPIAGNVDIVVMVVVATKEKNVMCFHREEHHDYEDYHPDSDCCENGSGFQSLL